MSERFIKYIPSEKALWLREHYPSCYLLLSVIAENARRYPDKIDGLEVGDSIVGRHETSKKAGISEKQYRGSLDKLDSLGYIEIVYNPEWNKKSYLENCVKIGVSPKCQKRAIKRAIKSCIVCLLDSDIYNINPIEEGQQKVQQGAIKGPQTKNEEEMKEYSFHLNKEMKMNMKKEKIISVSFADIREKEKFESFNAITTHAKIPIKENTLQRWIKKYSESLIDETLNEFVNKKDFKGNHEAWIEKTLSVKHNFHLNKEFITNFLKHNITCKLRLTKNYCVDDNTGNDYQFSLPHEKFVEIIERQYNSEAFELRN